MICVIPAAGKGTRLKANMPKALVKIDGESIISRQIKKLKSFCEIRVVVGYKKQLVIEEILNCNHKVKIYTNNQYNTTTVVDSVRIGIDNYTGNVLVVDGDVLFKDISSFITPDHVVGIKKITSQQPMYAQVSNNKVINFNETCGNYEWAGISVMPSNIYKYKNKFICDAISSLLPVKSCYIDAFEVDTPSDLKGAEYWITKK